MIKKKICMLGSFAVGKTSLVQQFVHSKFSDSYLTTIGVKIDQKIVNVNGEEVNLLLWDIHGEDEFQKIPTSYLKGSSGYFLIMDGTRISTLEIIQKIKGMTDEVLSPEIPFILLINKADLKDNWEIQEEDIVEIQNNNWQIIETSAKTGEGVEKAFSELSKMMLS